MKASKVLAAGALSFAAVVHVPLIVGASFVTTQVVGQGVAHADDWNCDDSYMPCDGANASFFDDPTADAPPPDDPIYQEPIADPAPDDSSIAPDDPTADAPMWTDPIYDQSLGDPGDPTYEPDMSWWGEDGPYW